MSKPKSQEQKEQDAMNPGFAYFQPSGPGYSAYLESMRQADLKPDYGSANAYRGEGQLSPGQMAYNAGRQMGQEEFYNDPDMQRIRARREDLAKGMEGEELGALRREARGQVQGQRGAYMRQLTSKAAKGGIGGARAAAMGAAADKGFLQATADAESKLTAQNIALKRQGVQDLQDLIFRQKFGSLATGLTQQQFVEAQGIADKQIAASKGGGSSELGGFLGNVFDYPLNPTKWF